MYSLLNYLINPLTLIIPILLAVAFLTLLERKVLGYMQLRKGPNIVGPYGLLQPIADGVKLFIKEPLRPTTASPTLFLMMPMMALLLALTIWTPLPLPQTLLDVNLGLLLILALSSLGVYSILWSGWASNSKYALIGALRAVAQTISYEVTLGIILLSTIMLTGSFTMQALLTTQNHTWLATCTWPLMMMWYTSTIAETNRAPFDLTEGESELVSGFMSNTLQDHSHYSSFGMCQHPYNKHPIMYFIPLPKLRNYPDTLLHQYHSLKHAYYPSDSYESAPHIHDFAMTNFCTYYEKTSSLSHSPYIYFTFQPQLHYQAYPLYQTLD
uniref:NADH-ubiquinone oxidoreductase chain 1 n=1 Tax=Teratoscincus roborowskii TaxID=102174 RepID=A0A0C4ZQ63_9SAUR|nr:NADH dehydrogenase subunit 1 [Teratoscincus roborowskii]AJJ48351.1 NADH dehydrogenase subunit 1 [Teratoscincus roborowskii]